MSAVLDLTSECSYTLDPAKVDTPGVLTISESDCSGDTGLETDIKTITVCGCHAFSCPTALTSKDSQGVSFVFPTSIDTLKQLIDSFKKQKSDIKAVKVGFVPEGSIQTIETFLKYLGSNGIHNLVLDAVFSLGGEKADTSRLISLFKIFRLVSVSFADSQKIVEFLQDNKVNHTKVDNVDQICDMASFIGHKVHSSIFIRGGNIPFNREGKNIDYKYPELVYDVLYNCENDSTAIFKSNFIHSSSTNGASSTLSAFVASSLAQGIKLTDSVERAIRFLNEAIRRAVPKINGPICHTWRGYDGNKNTKRNDTTDNYEGYIKYYFTPSVNFLNSLVLDKDIAPIWWSFTTHDFFRSLNNGTMTDSALHHVLIQDFRYLKVFLSCHETLQLLAPTKEAKSSMKEATQNVRNELGGHVKLLKEKYNISDPTTIQPSKALLDYAAFMTKWQEEGNFVELCSALIPCRFGFNQAISRFYNPERTYDLQSGNYIKGDRSWQEPCSSEYESWLQGAVSDRYRETAQVFQAVYNAAFADLHTLGKADIPKIKQIFADGCRLEYEFWDESFRA